MENNPDFYPPQQNWNQPPMPPQKSNTGWVKWVIIGVAAVGLIAWLIVSVASMGKKFGQVINDVSQNKFSKADSLQLSALNTEFDSVYSRIEKDSSSREMKFLIDDLKSSSDSVTEILNKNQDGFNDTIGDANAVSRLTQFWSQHYFLKTGRATKLKNMLLSYRENKIHLLPPYAQDSVLLRNYLMIDDVDKILPAYMRKFTGWENINFNQPVMNVNLNFRLIRNQVRNFEMEILIRFDSIIT
ncbi:MAG TPA: hypothetical protein VFJ43_02465, partial [Bacteroidia bacterium]|nr:hypothetical protein [Bacteroidia bacterium]